MDKISQRLAGWKSSLLNRVGKTCLAWSVLTSLPTFTVQGILMPSSICEEINRTVRSFLWSKSNDTNAIHLVGWDKVVRPKKLGGLAIREARNSNIPLPGKLTWRILNDRECLWVKALSHKYLGKNSVLSATTPPTSSIV
ncbi:ribonuclease H [Sesbania bispinosa]|nr:ribonuclease H [Sesbania bispinosa]